MLVSYNTVKPRNYESQNNDTSRNRIIDEALTEVSVEQSHNYDKSYYYYGFCADRGPS